MSSVTGELDSDESIDAEVRLESDTCFGLGMTAGLAKNVNFEHHCSADRMRTCSTSDPSNHSFSVISLDFSIGSSLWKPAQFKNSLASITLFGLIDFSILGSV